MELRDYLEILKRRRWLIVIATVVVAALAAVSSSMRPSVYSASAAVLLRPNDAAEQLYPERAGSRPNDPNRNVAAQLDIVESEAVAVAAARELNRELGRRRVSAKALLGQVSAHQRPGTDVIEISVTDADPERAADVANAFTEAYIENRRQFAVTGLQRASDEIEGNLTELEGRIADLNAQIIDSKRVVTIPADPRRGTPAMTTTVGDNGAPLEAARDAATLQYETLYARQQELLVTKSLKRGEAEIIADAEAPKSPISPNPKRDLMVGAFLGLLVGLGISLLREQLDERLRSREDVERLTSLPVLAELPLDTESTRLPNAIATHERPLGSLAESTRGLRTSISFLGVDEPLRLIVVTSSGPGEGKSLVAANLATAYAQTGVRTVLVSADLRRPRLESVFATTPGTGLSDLLVSRSPITSSGSNGNGSHGSMPAVDTLPKVVRDALRPTHIDNLFLLSAGKLPPNPAELLGSARATEVLQALTAVADVVIIDTPPVLAVTDATVLASRADGVVVVAASGHTHRKALAQSVATLTAGRFRLLGIVFNKVNESSRSTYYGTYGGYLPEEPTARRRPWKRNAPAKVEK